ncbi:universal stress protein [Streptomyces sp. B6B3]|uniref:universal stress protein n=1 Tax=Streptomyces sp. B6B3 TaxID=3153570 RepID=UPI00325C6D32
MDGTLAAFRALDHAAAEAVRHGTSLELVGAAADPADIEAVLTTAARRARRRHPGLPVTRVPAPGDAAGTLLGRGRDATLTVVGCRGLGALSGRLLGSVSARLARRSLGPLLVVRGEGIPSRSVYGGTVLLGASGAAGADAATYAFAETARRHASLRVLPVDDGGASQASEARGEDGIAGPSGRAPGPSPREALLAATEGADVVVVATRRRIRWWGHRLGATTRLLLRRSRCPVLIIPVSASPDEADRAGRRDRVSPKPRDGRVGRTGPPRGPFGPRPGP